MGPVQSTNDVYMSVLPYLPLRDIFEQLRLVSTTWHEGIEQNFFNPPKITINAGNPAAIPYGCNYHEKIEIWPGRPYDNAANYLAKVGKVVSSVSLHALGDTWPQAQTILMENCVGGNIRKLAVHPWTKTENGPDMTQMFRQLKTLEFSAEHFLKELKKSTEISKDNRLELPWLEELIMRGSSGTEVWELISCPRLTKLHATDKKFLTDHLSNLAQLTDLDIRGMSLEKDTITNIAQTLPHLRELAVGEGKSFTPTTAVKLPFTSEDLAQFGDRLSVLTLDNVKPEGLLDLSCAGENIEELTVRFGAVWSGPGAEVQFKLATKLSWAKLRVLCLACAKWTTEGLETVMQAGNLTELSLCQIDFPKEDKDLLCSVATLSSRLQYLELDRCKHALINVGTLDKFLATVVNQGGRFKVLKLKQSKSAVYAGIEKEWAVEAKKKYPFVVVKSRWF
eukprot:TRINITY_DN4512_c0_g1_i1.p1 TRINITY_DN4512_c0_g1~~TRINITY_DN4512_c0_g1_i1.p1  ORF type:complete len:451 (-),score=17.98 TRINITY_DN4512_c0_g1_i1:453-1805(-)